MMMGDMGALLARRWYLVVVVILATVGVGFVANSKLPTQYETSASVVLLPPTNPEQPGDNRFLGLGGLGQTVDVLVRALNARDVRLSLEGSAPAATYEIAPDYTSNAPILVITVRGQQGAARPLMDQVVSAIGERLNAIQEAVGTPKQYRIVSLPVASDRDPSPLARSRLRKVIMVAAATLVLGLGLVAAADGLLRTRRRRRPRADEVTDDDSDLEPPMSSIARISSASTDQSTSTSRRSRRGRGRRAERQAEEAEESLEVDAAAGGR